ncbi:GntR family transcriptional regulator [Paraglaciecola sp. 25GB23A]|uniref:GntR family transcriptional regulator n=1 Tax=Paraglaciecola sp. 25GB23A TaxID=3156068 RepID=UPI0032AF4738
MTFGLFLSSTDKKPMYLQIVEQITSKVMVGDWLADMPLPSIRELAASTQVSVITVKRAYLELERAGVIVTQPGKGSYVSTNSELNQELRKQEFEQHLAESINLAKQLQLSDDDIITCVKQHLGEHKSPK